MLVFKDTLGWGACRLRIQGYAWMGHAEDRDLGRDTLGQGACRLDIQSLYPSILETWLGPVM